MPNNWVSAIDVLSENKKNNILLKAAEFFNKEQKKLINLITSEINLTAFKESATENIEKFKKRFLHAANSALNEQDILPKLYLNAEANFKDLTYDLLSSLELFEPYGNENLQPILYCEAKQAWPPKVIGGSHLKLYLEQEDRMLEGIAFGMADKVHQLKKRNLKLKIAYVPQINRFHNKSSIQLIIKDFQIVN